MSFGVIGIQKRKKILLNFYFYFILFYLYFIFYFFAFLSCHNGLTNCFEILNFVFSNIILRGV